jgi:hypothetical protein
MLHFVQSENYSHGPARNRASTTKRSVTTSRRKPVARSSISRRSTSVKVRSSSRFSTCGVSSSSQSRHSGNVTHPIYHSSSSIRGCSLKGVRCPPAAQTSPNSTRATSTHGHQRRGRSESFRANFPSIGVQGRVLLKVIANAARRVRIPPSLPLPLPLPLPPPVAPRSLRLVRGADLLRGHGSAPLAELYSGSAIPTASALGEQTRPFPANACPWPERATAIIAARTRKATRHSAGWRRDFVPRRPAVIGLIQLIPVEP